MRLFMLLAALALGLASYGLYRQHCQEKQLLTQLRQLNPTLDFINSNNQRAVDQALLALKESAAKNRNSPHDLAQLATATRLHNLANGLVDTLHAHRTAVLRAPGSPLAPDALPNLPKASAEQQLARYTHALAPLTPFARSRLSAPVSQHLPIVAVLTDLAHLENQVRTAEIGALQQLAKATGAADLRSRFVAAATAEKATVAPGDTYRARLLLVKYLLPQTMHMYCNGQPVIVGPDGIGQVRFRAPIRPGAASWTAVIRINQNGRDTTFTVRVPYRVAHR